MSEKSGGFLLLKFLQTLTPKNYPKLLYPVHGVDKIIIEFNSFQGKQERYETFPWSRLRMYYPV